MLAISPNIRITFGLVMLTLSILLVADFFGLTRDNSEAYFDTRKKFSETLSIQLSKFIEKSNFNDAKMLMKELIKRNPDVKSLAIRSGNGNTLIAEGDSNVG